MGFLGPFAPVLLSEVWQRGFAHKGLKLWELLQAEPSLQPATPEPAMVQTEEAKTAITDPSQNGHLISQKRPWLQHQQGGCWVRKIPNLILLADAPALSFSAAAPAKLEPGTFRLLMPSRAQVKS